MCISLLMFVLSNQIWLAMLSRFLTGAFQVFMLVYFPVWIDKFGGEKATTWITLLQIGVPLGIFAGYGMTAVIVQTSVVSLILIQWQYSFYVQICLIVICMVAFFFVKL
jgi:MFS family permease